MGFHGFPLNRGMEPPYLPGRKAFLQEAFKKAVKGEIKKAPGRIAGGLKTKRRD
jgi:hypothetical protein